MQPVPLASGDPALRTYVRRLVAGRAAPLAELADAAADLAGSAAVVLTLGQMGDLQVEHVAATEEATQERLAAVLASLDLSGEVSGLLRAAFRRARPELANEILPARWHVWTVERDLSSSIALPLSHGEDLIGWLWVATASDPALVESLRDLAAIVAMRHTLLREADARSSDAMGLEVELSHRSDQLENANQTVDALAAVVGHDVREVFRELLGWSRLGTDVDATDDLREELFHKMRIGVERIGGILGDVLEDVADAQAVRRDVVAVDLNGIFAWVQRVLGDRIDADGATLTLGRLPTIRTSPTVLRGVALELVRNALEHGGPSVSIRVNAETPDGNVEILIEDDGPGIPEMDRALMFRAGFGTGPGTGMGLTRVRALLKQVDGAVALEAARTGGVLARVTIPSDHRRG